MRLRPKGSRMRAEQSGEWGAWRASDDGRITALFTPRWFPVRDMTAGTNRNCAPEAYSRAWDQLRSGETSSGRAVSLGGISAVFWSPGQILFGEMVESGS